MTTFLTINEIEQWFNKRLRNKYRKDIDHLYYRLRPLFALYSHVIEETKEIRLLLVPSGNDWLVKSTVDNILQQLLHLTQNFPICIDFDFLNAFCNASDECFRNITAYLHSLSHEAIFHDFNDSASNTKINLLNQLFFFHLTQLTQSRCTSAT